MIDRAKSQIPIVEDQARDAIRRIELNVRVLEDQLSAAMECEIEAVRSGNKELAYELSLLGVNVIDRVNETEDQIALKSELEAMLERARKKDIEAAGANDDLDGFFT